MEFLIVEFSEDRGVIVNGAPGRWRTNKLLLLQPGTYIVKLAAPANYTPAQQEVELEDTTVLDPAKVIFTKVP